MTEHDAQAAREEIGRTVDAIAYKADLPARAADSVSGRIDALKSTFEEGARGERAAYSGGADGLNLALGAFAVGCVVGALLPVTPLERDRAAAVGDRLAASAAERLTEKIARVKGAILRGRADFGAA